MLHFQNLKIRAYNQHCETFAASTVHYVDSISKMCNCLLSDKGDLTIPSFDKEYGRIEHKVEGYKRELAPAIKLQKQQKDWDSI